VIAFFRTPVEGSLERLMFWRVKCNWESCSSLSCKNEGCPSWGIPFRSYENQGE